MTEINKYNQRDIQIGDVLARFLPEYQVWHTGIVVKVDKQHYDFIDLMEFDDTNEISIVTLRQYLWGRKYFWVLKFDAERKKMGDKVFRSRKDRVLTAYDIYKKNNLKYTIHKYNCEYFTRRCVFNNELLWPSSQTVRIAKSRSLFYIKLFSVMAFGVIHNINKDKEFEKNLNTTDYPYKCIDSKIIFIGN